MKLPGFVSNLNVDCLALDQNVNLDIVDKFLPSVHCIQGNLNPLTLVSGKERLESETLNILESCYDFPHIFNLGHGILPTTPIQHVEKLVKLIREF